MSYWSGYLIGGDIALESSAGVDLPGRILDFVTQHLRHRISQNKDALSFVSNSTGYSIRDGTESIKLRVFNFEYCNLVCLVRRHYFCRVAGV